MDSYKMCLQTLEEQEIEAEEKEWCIQQEYDKKHEERKLKIEEYKRKRAVDIKKQTSMYERRSKSSSPRRREDSSPDYRHFKESRSHSLVSEQIKQRRIDNDKNKFSSRSPNQTCKLDNRVSSKPLMNYSFADNFDNLYMSLSRPMLMPRIQTQSMLMPVFSPLFPGPLPNIHQWQRPPANRAHGWQRNRNQH